MWKAAHLHSPRTRGVVLALLLVLLAPAAAGAREPGVFQQTDGGSSHGSPPPTDATTPGADQQTIPPPLGACQVVTSSEASSLAGTAYSTGVTIDNSGGGQTCVYGSQTLNVFSVTVAQVADAGTAQAAWAQQEAEVQSDIQRNLPPGVNVNLTFDDLANLSGFDRAALGGAATTILGRPFNVSGIFLLKGATFVAFSDVVVGQPAPTSDALQSEAQTVLGRLP
jgi:hypothetical protein